MEALPRLYLYLYISSSAFLEKQGAVQHSLRRQWRGAGNEAQQASGNSMADGVVGEDANKSQRGASSEASGGGLAAGRR